MRLEHGIWEAEARRQAACERRPGVSASDNLTDCCNFDPCPELTFENPGRIHRALANVGFANQHEPCDETRTPISRTTVEWLAANRRRTPGSWERSRVKRNRPSTRCGPSRASRSGGFFVFRSTARRRISRRKPERETRIPGLAPERCVPKARGLSEGTRRKLDTDDRANPEGFANAAPFARRSRIHLNLVCRLAAQPTLVVKISDTSLKGKSGFDSRLLMSRTVEAALQGPLRRGLRFFPQGKDLRCHH